MQIKALRPLLSVLVLCGLIAACGGGGGGGGPGPRGPDAPANGASQAALAVKMGVPARFLVGLGAGAPEASVSAQGLRPDILDAYLVNAGAGDWTTWDLPAGAYVDVAAARAERVGAVPMFTLYQMATNGDGNLSGLTDAAFMTRYWDNVRLMYERIAAYGKPVLVTVEPDFWGYVQLHAPGGDPDRMPARVGLNPDCSALPDNATGVARCIVSMARVHAPKALVGFSPSGWGAADVRSVAVFMTKVGAGEADYVAVQTLDRDAGCFEAKGSECTRGGTGHYWDEAAFQEHLREARVYFDTIGLPLVWWQTPLGVPSAAPGGAPGRYRDNRVQLFLTRTPELVAAGGVGAVFSIGAASQTTIETDAGQFRRLSDAYLRSPAPLP